MMKRHLRLQWFAALFLAVQVLAGYAGWFTPRHEIFPFTSWFLFSLVPNRVKDYDLLLHGTPNQPQEPPQSFNRSGALVYAPHSIVTYQLIQQLGDAVRQEDAPRVEFLRRQIEEQFAVGPMGYDLLELTYKPVARWKTGQVVSSRLVRSFVATEPPGRSQLLDPP